MDDPVICMQLAAIWLIPTIDNERVSRAKEIQGEACLFLCLHNPALAGAGPALRRYREDLGPLISGNIEWS